MIKIAISQAAFDALAATLPLGSVGYENQINERGERLIWLDHGVVARLRAMRGPGESYSDALLRLAGETTPTKRGGRGCDRVTATAGHRMPHY